jgi:hypothetical protein
VSQQEFDLFLKVILPIRIRLSLVMPLHHAEQQGGREGLAGGFVDRPCCWTVVARRSEHHCEGSKFVACARRFLGPKQVMSAGWVRPEIT